MKPFGIACVALLAACSDDGIGTEQADEIVRSALLTTEQDTSVGRTLAVAAYVRNASGDYFEAKDATFSVDPAKGRLDITGVRGTFEPLVPGDIAVTLTAEGLTSTFTYRVIERRPVGAARRTMEVGYDACYVGIDNATYCYLTLLPGGLTPTLVTTLPFVSLSLSDYAVCGLTAAGAVHCKTNDNPDLTLQDFGAVEIAVIASGREYGKVYTCALSTNDVMSCKGTTPRNDEPLTASRSGLSESARCQISSSWEVLCAPWVDGDNLSDGELGYGYGEPPSPPVVAGGLFWDSVVDGIKFSCGLTKDGTGYCWGTDEYGQTGSTAAKDVCAGTGLACAERPVVIAGDHTWKMLSATDNRACGLDTAGRAWCWGRYAIGDGIEHGSPIPLAVSGNHVFTQISVGTRMTCASTATGELWCWGTLPEAGPSPVLTLVPTRMSTPVAIKEPS